MISRRTVLRGLGATVGVPLLDCFLNGNGTALADGGALPVRFGTWTWGCGMTASRWVPKTVGGNYDLPPELTALSSLKQKVNILSGFSVRTDGKENKPHVSGAVGIRTGTTPTGPVIYSQPTIDLLVSDAIGGATRFRSLDMAATGNPEHSYSARSTSVVNAAIPTPAAMYARVFGADFKDPNAATFTPDPNIMVRNSVLSVVKDEREAFMKNLGAADRARLDQYFTSVRQLEQQLALQLEKPQPLKACTVPEEQKNMPPGTEITAVTHNHRLMSQILAHALACNQTRVFNMVFSDFTSSLRKRGSAETHHGITHEETADAALGYQVEASWFIAQSMKGWADFLTALNDIPEGPGTLLDNTIVFAHSDTQYARTHTLDGIPMMIAGGGGGQLRTGLHIAGNGDAATRAGLTLLQMMKVPVDRWGTGSLETAKPITDLLA
jgi:hypothetical protein